MEEEVEGKVELEGHAARNEERCKRRKRREEGDRMAVYNKRTENREQRAAAKGYFHPVLQGCTTQDDAEGTASCTSWLPHKSPIGPDFQYEGLDWTGSPIL